MSSDTHSSVLCVASEDAVGQSSDAVASGQATSIVPGGFDDPSNTTHVTIQLPSDASDSTLSQQKLQELILQLSQSGQIQLKEDSKIVIDLKFTDKAEQSSATEPGRSATAVSRQSNSASTGFKSGQQELKQSPPMKLESTLMSAPNSTRLRAPQQPAYFIVSAGQLSAADTQLYSSNSAHARSAASGGTVLRTVNASGASMTNHDRNVILVPQQAAGGKVASNANQSAVISANGSATLVPLRQITGGTVGRVASNTTWVSANSTRLVGTGSGSDWYVNNSPVVNVVSRSGQNSYLSSGSNPSGANQRESSWQQYVKQFAKLGPCPICGDRISGYHYGIFCCESCKGFFKRTVQNGKRYACHHPGGSAVCDINMGSRKKCPACRFIKCIEKGMRIEAIRSDRTRGGRSMYPGSRYLRQVASRVGSGRTGDVFADDPNMKMDDNDQLSCTLVGLSGVHHNLGPDGLPSSVDAGGGVYLDPAILGHQGDEDDDDPERSQMQLDQPMLDYSSGTSCGTPFVGRHVIVTGASDAATRARIELPKVITEILSVEESVEAEPEDILEIDPSNAPPGTTIPEGVTEDEAAVYRALLNLADQRLYRTVRWSRALPDFAQLDTDDQILLLQNCWADLLCLDCCWRSLPTPTEIRLTSSKCINLEAAKDLGAEEIVERMLQLTQYLTELELDLIEYACLKVIVLMQPDLKNLKAASHVRQYQESVQQVLLDYISKSSPTKPDKYSKLLSRIPELQVTSHNARLMLVDLDLSPFLSSNSLLMELLRSDIQRYAPAGSSATAEETTQDETADAAATVVENASEPVTLPSDSMSEQPEQQQSSSADPSDIPMTENTTGQTNDTS